MSIDWHQVVKNTLPGGQEVYYNPVPPRPAYQDATSGMKDHHPASADS